MSEIHPATNKTDDESTVVRFGGQPVSTPPRTLEGESGLSISEFPGNPNRALGYEGGAPMSEDQDITATASIAEGTEWSESTTHTAEAKILADAALSQTLSVEDINGPKPEQ